MARNIQEFVANRIYELMKADEEIWIVEQLGDIIHKCGSREDALKFIRLSIEKLKNKEIESGRDGTHSIIHQSDTFEISFLGSTFYFSIQQIPKNPQPTFY